MVLRVFVVSCQQVVYNKLLIDNFSKPCPCGLNSTTNPEVFPPVFFLEMKIHKCFKYVQIPCVLFLLTSSFAND